MPICVNFFKVHLNSIAGIRALALASRTCRALASPYFFQPRKCDFKELVRNDQIDDPPVVTLSAVDNFKTLKLSRRPQPRRDETLTITQILSVDNTYESLEFLPDESYTCFSLSAPALDLLNRHLPLLSRLVIDIGQFDGYSTCWDQAYKKTHTRDSHAPTSYVDGSKIICILAGFQNLRNLVLHFKLQHDQVALMHPKIGCDIVRELFESIKSRKQGQTLSRLEVVFRAESADIFGISRGPFRSVATTFAVVCIKDSSTQDRKQPRYSCTCENPDLGKAIERRNRLDKVYGDHMWTWHLKELQWNLSRGRYTTAPWHVIMESLMVLALLPSYLVFENSKRVQYEPSLANVDVRYPMGYSKRSAQQKRRKIVKIFKGISHQSKRFLRQ